MIADESASNRNRESQMSQRGDRDEQNLNRLMANYRGFQEPSENNDGVQAVIYSQEVLPLVKALNEENGKLKEEKSIIAEEFKRLDFLTDTLKQENEQMKQHCHMRSLDLEKTIETISLNLTEEESDMNHRIHLLREENNIIVKFLSELLSERGQLEDRIAKDEQSNITQLGRMREDEMRVLDEEAKIDQMKSEIAELQRSCQEALSSYEDCNEEVNRLCISNMKMRNGNIERIYELKEYEQEISGKKPKLERQNMKLHSGILLLKKEVHELAQQVESRKRKLERLNETAQKQREEVGARQAETDSHTFALQEAKDAFQQHERLMSESRQREALIESELQQRNRKLDELHKHLKAIDAENRQQQTSFSEQLKEKRQSYSDSIKTLQGTLSKRGSAYSQERNSLEYTIRELKLSIEDVRKEIKDQEADAQELHRQMSTHTQTNKEVQRLIYQLKQVEQELVVYRSRKAP